MLKIAATVYYDQGETEKAAVVSLVCSIIIWEGFYLDKNTEKTLQNNQR
jgi:hypothetical protein